MKEFKWQILWSTRNSPQEIARLISDIRIKVLLEQRALPILGYSASDFDSYGDYLLPDLRKPHGRAWDISIEDGRYMATFGVIDEFVPIFCCINDPVIHPTILGDYQDPKTFKIAQFHVYDKRHLNQKNIYNGTDSAGEKI